MIYILVVINSLYSINAPVTFQEFSGYLTCADAAAIVNTSSGKNIAYCVKK